jgi:hypothetical protein
MSVNNQSSKNSLNLLTPNLEIASSFLKDITHRWPEIGEGLQLEVTGIRPYEKGNDVRAALYPATEEGVAAALNKAMLLNSQRFNIYFAPNPIAPDVKLNNAQRPKDIDTAGAVFVFADGDDDAASNALLKDLLSSILVRTGTVPGPRVHAYWELSETIKFQENLSRDKSTASSDEWRGLQAGLIDHFGSDVQIKNPSRLMRLPGFISHAKDETRVDELVTWEKTGSGPVDFKQLPKASSLIDKPALADINTAHTSMQKLLKKSDHQSLSDEDIRAKLEDSRIQGHWHNNMLIVTASLVAKGWNDQRICEFCGPYCVDGSADPELKIMIDGAREKGWGSDLKAQEPIQSHIQPKPIFNLIRVGDIQFREPEYLIDGLIESSSLVQMFGDPGAGKSFLALDVAACVATGKAFHGLEVKQGPVIYVAGEGYNGIRRRLTGWEINQLI